MQKINTNDKGYGSVLRKIFLRLNLMAHPSIIYKILF